MRPVCPRLVHALPLVLAALVGCVAGDDDDGPSDDGSTDDGSTDDGSDGSDDGSGDDGVEPPACVDPADRAGLSVTVSGHVLDHATGEPIEADVAFNTAWDVADDFPAGCDPLATFVTDVDGAFGPETVDANTVNDPPIGIFLVSGDDVADTLSDTRMTCSGAECDDVDHTIVAPTRELADGWREQMEVDGMADATTRGLIVFRFREADGSPAEGVVPQTLSGPDLLRPDLDMRFLDEDGVSLAPAGTDRTTASGIALIALGDEAPTDYVFGTRGEERWSALGVLAPPGWLFLEDERPVP